MPRVGSHVAADDAAEEALGLRLQEVRHACRAWQRDHAEVVGKDHVEVAGKDRVEVAGKDHAELVDAVEAIAPGVAAVCSRTVGTVGKDSRSPVGKGRHTAGHCSSLVQHWQLVAFSSSLVQDPSPSPSLFPS